MNICQGIKIWVLGGGLAYIYILLWIIKSIDCRLHILMEDFWLPKHQTPPKLKFPGNHPCPKLPKLIVRTLTSIQGAARHCIQMPKSQTGRQAPMPSCFSPKLPAPFIKQECTSKTMVFFMNLSNADMRLFLPLNPENCLFMPSAY